MNFIFEWQRENKIHTKQGFHTKQGSHPLTDRSGPGLSADALQDAKLPVFFSAG